MPSGLLQVFLVGLGNLLFGLRNFLVVIGNLLNASTPAMVRGMRTGYPRVLNKGLGSKFCGGS